MMRVVGLALVLASPCVFATPDYQPFATGSECAVGNDRDQGERIGDGYMSFAECAAAACDSSGNCAQWIEYGTGTKCEDGNSDNCKCYQVAGEFGCSDPLSKIGYNIFALTAPGPGPPPATWTENAGISCTGRNELGIAGIKGSAKKLQEDITVEDAKAYCESESTCVSFEYKPTTGRLQFSTSCLPSESKDTEAWSLYVIDRPAAAGECQDFSTTKQKGGDTGYVDRSRSSGTDDWSMGTIYLDRHNIKCSSGVLSRFQMQGSGKKNDKKVWYDYTCCQTGVDFSSDACATENTADNDKGGQYGDLVYLDRHNMKCGSNSAMSSYKLNTNAEKISYESKCCNIPDSDFTCVRKSTTPRKKTEKNNGGAEYLDRHNVKCPDEFQSLTSVRMRTPGANINYNYVCCAVTPLQPTNSPTNMPTDHPCDDGDHGCDESSTMCAVSDDGTSFCECLEGFVSTDSSTSCAATASPTQLPTEEPTVEPTDEPTAEPTHMPTDHPCDDGNHGCDEASTMCGIPEGGVGTVCQCLEGFVPTDSATSCAPVPVLDEEDDHEDDDAGEDSGSGSGSGSGGSFGSDDDDVDAIKAEIAEVTAEVSSGDFSHASELGGLQDELVDAQAAVTDTGTDSAASAHQVVAIPHALIIEAGDDATTVPGDWYKVDATTTGDALGFDDVAQAAYKSALASALNDIVPTANMVLLVDSSTNPFTVSCAFPVPMQSTEAASAALNSDAFVGAFTDAAASTSYSVSGITQSKVVENADTTSFHAVFGVAAPTSEGATLALAVAVQTSAQPAPSATSTLIGVTTAGMLCVGLIVAAIKARRSKASEMAPIETVQTSQASVLDTITSLTPKLDLL